MKGSRIEYLNLVWDFIHRFVYRLDVSTDLLKYLANTMSAHPLCVVLKFPLRSPTNFSHALKPRALQAVDLKRRHISINS